MIIKSGEGVKTSTVHQYRGVTCTTAKRKERNLYLSCGKRSICNDYHPYKFADCRHQFLISRCKSLVCLHRDAAHIAKDTQIGKVIKDEREGKYVGRFV